ncbi:hypothetical protein CW304_11925 [Bacillus sp. UFRGS-B20]|nr:hypothetical protein CW304_11925 [Bacillus sp. UFRGS-B20]
MNSIAFLNKLYFHSITSSRSLTHLEHEEGARGYKIQVPISRVRYFFYFHHPRSEYKNCHSNHIAAVANLLTMVSFIIYLHHKKYRHITFSSFRMPCGSIYF